MTNYPSKASIIFLRFLDDKPLTLFMRLVNLIFTGRSGGTTHVLVSLPFNNYSTLVIDNHLEPAVATTVITNNVYLHLSECYPTAIAYFFEVPYDPTFERDVYQGHLQRGEFLQWLRVRLFKKGGQPLLCTFNAIRLLKLLGVDAPKAPTVSELHKITEDYCNGFCSL